MARPGAVLTLRRVSISRGFDGASPLEPEPVSGISGWREERRDTRTTRMASGTLACPSCDAPVASPERPVPPSASLACGFCGLDGSIRDFLTLGEPTRPTRVAVHVRTPAARPARRAARR